MRVSDPRMARCEGRSSISRSFAALEGWSWAMAFTKVANWIGIARWANPS